MSIHQVIKLFAQSDNAQKYFRASSKFNVFGNQPLAPLLPASADHKSDSNQREVHGVPSSELPVGVMRTMMSTSRGEGGAGHDDDDNDDDEELRN